MKLIEDVMYEHFVESAWKGYCWGYDDSKEGKKMLSKKQLIKEINEMIKAVESLKEGVEK